MTIASGTPCSESTAARRCYSRRASPSAPQYPMCRQRWFPSFSPPERSPLRSWMRCCSLRCCPLYCRIRSCCRTVRLPSKMLQCHIFFVSYAIPLFCCSPVKTKRVNKKSKKFLPTRFFLFSTLERATRIELATSAWEADVLPLNYARRRRPQTVKNLELET